MSTLKEELESVVLSRVAPDEPIFVLRAQDELASAVVREWCVMARLAGCPREKVHEAAAVADAMDQWMASLGSK